MMAAGNTFTPQSMDAQLWAKEFMKHYHENPEIIQEDVMVGWFANAIMAGYDEAMRRK